MTSVVELFALLGSKNALAFKSRHTSVMDSAKANGEALTREQELRPHLLAVKELGTHDSRTQPRLTITDLYIVPLAPGVWRAYETCKSITPKVTPIRMSQSALYALTCTEIEAIYIL